MNWKSVSSLTACLLMTCFIIVQAQNAMIIETKDGKSFTTNLSLIKKITFESENINVSTYDNDLKSYPISNVTKVKIEDLSTVGIENPSKNSWSASLGIYPNPATDVINVSGTLSENKIVCIYSLSGQCVLQTNVSSANSSINISSLSKGIYMVKINNQAFKLIKI